MDGVMTQPKQTPEPEHAAPALDLNALVDAVVKAPQKLEREWSRALNTPEVASGYQDFQNQIAALFRAIHLKALEVGSIEEGLGHSNTMDKWPITLSEAAALDLDAQGEAKYKQLICAQTYAMVEFANSVKGAAIPTGREVKLPMGSVETWWESGAFNRVRRSAKLVSRIWDEISASQVAPVSQSNMRAGWLYFELGQDALASALPEAAITYFNIAIKELASALSGVVLTIPEAIVRLRRVQRFAEISDLLEVSMKLAADHAQGLLTDLSVAIPVAYNLPIAFGLLIMPLTGAERTKLTEGLSDASGGGSDE